MQLPEPVEPRHSLCDRPLAHPVHGDRDLRNAAVAMEAGADAEDRGRPANRHGSGQRAIERDVESGIGYPSEVLLYGDHDANARGYDPLAMFLRL